MAAALLLGVALVPPIASAPGLTGGAKGAESTTVGTWGTTASPTSMTFTTSTGRTSTVANAGTIALNAESYSVTVSKPASGTPTFKLFQCTTAWVTNECSGAAGTPIGGTLAANSTTTVTATSGLAVSADTYLQVEPTSVTASTTVTLSTKVTSPTQLRSAVATNRQVSPGRPSPSRNHPTPRPPPCLGPFTTGGGARPRVPGCQWFDRRCRGAEGTIGGRGRRGGGGRN